MCASLVAYSCTRDCERWLQSGSNFSLGLSRFQFCPPVLSPFALPQLSCCLSFGFLHTRARARPREREREREREGGELVYVHAYAAYRFGRSTDICWLAFGRDYPVSKPSVFLSLSELQQVQFTSIGTKRMQKWIGRHERLTSRQPTRKKNTMPRATKADSWPRTTIE